MNNINFKISYGRVVSWMLLINFLVIPGNFPGFNVVGINYIKEMGLLGLSAILLFWSFPNLLAPKNRSAIIALLIILTVYFTVTLIWSESLYNSMRYINKVWLTSALVLVFLSSTDREMKTFLVLFPRLLIFFIGLSIFSEIFLRNWIFPEAIRDPRFAGFSGIHSTKYLFSISTIFFLVFGFFYNKKLYKICFILSIFLAILSLQRALIMALVVAVICIYFVHLLRQKKIKTLFFTTTISVVLVTLSFFLIFEFEPIRSRMFYTERHAVMAKQLILKGDILETYSMVQKTGRERFWLAAGSNSQPVFGSGFGTAGYMVQRTIGEYWEMHNDYLKLYVETGYIGVGLYLLFVVIFIFVASRKAIKTSNKLSMCLYYVSIGVFLVTPLNGIFDNALDHIAKNILFGTVFFIIGLRFDKTLMNDNIRYGST